MSRRLRSRTLIADLRRVFRSDEKRLIDAYVARLSVLYEDLRIEILAINADSIPRLDVLDPVEENTEFRNIGKYRRNYFLRRSIGTLYEFAEGLRLLSECPDFAGVRATFDDETAIQWNAATAFFHSQERLIQNVRNDIGGHFGSKAAIYAVPNLSPGAVATIDIFYDAEQLPCPPQLRFAGEIAAAAFTKHLPGNTVEEQVGGFMQNVLVPGYRHATECVHVLVVFYLWPRFGI